MRILTLLAVLAAPTIAFGQEAAPTADTAGEIVPMDGTWSVTPRETSVGDGCPAEMTAALDGMAEQMSQASTFDVAWNGDFDPSAAEIEGGNDGVEWAQVDNRTWDGEMKVSPEEPAVGTLRMHITEPGMIESTTTIAVGPLMQAQGQEIPDMETCEIELVSDMAHES